MVQYGDELIYTIGGFVMIKKRKSQIYKSGMEAGAKPFQDKFEQTTKQIRKTGKQVKDIAKTQKKNQKVTNQIIDGVQKIDCDLKKTKSNVAKQSKQNKKQREVISNIEIMMPSITATCNYCGKPIESHQIICSSCGMVGKTFPYNLTRFDLKDICFTRVAGLSKTIKKAKNIEEDWLYPELNDKFIKMKKIQEISAVAMKKNDKENVSAYKHINSLANEFFNKYRKKRIEIAVVGTVKAGKSSLINALLGADLASVKATPETSILVKYRTTADENYLKITFYTGEEWNTLWSTTKLATVFLDEYKNSGAEHIRYDYLGKKEQFIRCKAEELPKIMMEWSKSDSPKHFFVKEIEVGYQSESLPHDVYLVDTPGLSDPVKYRSDITRDYITKSDWILACITSEKLSEQPEFHFLSKVIENKGGDVSKIFVVATKKDILVESERVAKRNEFLARLVQLYNNEELAISRFSFVAAECHIFTSKVILGEELEANDRRKMRKMLADLDMDMEDITEESGKVIDYAGVQALFNKVNKVVLSKRRSIIIDEIYKDYAQCMVNINSYANEYIEDAKDFLDNLTSENEMDTNKIEELQESNKQLAILQEQVKNLKRELEIKIAANSSSLIK